ncbi:TPA: toprim domain-containing protein [Streptococcus equi subsp. zooepidemicus]|nr:toprim domain-containing protein [Streptococcus equi subsp. zooepidemicus]HEL0700605.1 toprim domain-containing protein [Streptococcus equi subsp. zooepidemicus]HEL1083154.1 toprim domain-containing protein [Streptococcus equi subsp. zooepidemicus]HEL1353133.1 toprim domain-containing protein [Streptococcus equi subsp. zooepidemicus]
MAEKTWEESVQYAKSRSILDVAADLNMELYRQGKEYRWKEHDSLVITPSNNLWNWFSKEDVGGDVIELVQTIKEVDFKQAVSYLNTGDFKQVVAQTQVSQEAFRYYLAPYEQPFDEARRYLKEERGLSDDTIDFFYDKGVLAQANAKVGNDIEPVLVFKNLDENGQVVGAALQGLVANPDKYFGRGYLKQIMKNSQPYNGMHVDIGTPNRLIFSESSIDLMSYYEIHKDSLSDVRLVSLEGLKTGTMGRHLVQLRSEMERRQLSSSWTDDILSQGLDEAVKQGYFKDGKNSQLLTLAVDNDPKGKQLIQGLKDKGIPVIDATPPKQEDQSKMDWNDYLKHEKRGDNLTQIPVEHLITVARKELPANIQSNEKVQDLLGQVEELGHYVQYISEQIKTEGVGSVQSELEMTISDFNQVKEAITKAMDSQIDELSIAFSQQEKSLDDYQKTGLGSEQQKNERTSQRKGSLQPEAEGSTLPVLETSTFDRSVTSRPTRSSHYLKFTIKDGFKSRKTRVEKSIDAYHLGKLNRRGYDLQEAAQFYLTELANSTIHYFTMDGSLVQVNFLESNFMHLTGLKIVGKGATPESILHDFARGGELSYEDIRLKNTESPFDKIKVLPDLETVLQTDSFYFDQLQNISRYEGRFDSLIKADDSDLMVLFRMNTEDGTVPVSVFKARQILRDELKGTRKNEILGIFRERDGQIEQIAVNSSYVKDGGQEMLRLLQTNSVQEGVSSPKPAMTKAPLSPKSKIKEAIQRQAKQALTDLTVSSAEKNKGFDYHKASAYELSQQAIQDIKAFTESPEDLKAYLDFMSRFPQLSPRNAALIQAQWPGANAVATFKQWQELGKALDLGDADVMASKRTYTNKRTGESKEVVDHNLSVKAGEKSQITLFRPVMVAMIPVLDDKGKQVINQKGNPKFKPLSQATPDEKALVKAQKLKVSHFQDVDVKGNRKFMTYKVFELSQTTLKPESYPKAMPNRHYDFNLDQVKTKEVLQGLQDYANYIKVSIATDGQNGQDKQLGNAKGAFYPLEQKILLNPSNTQGEKISTTIHELAHATLHNPQLTQGKQNDLTKPQKELEAEMTSYLVSKHFGLDTAEKAIPYMAKWTNQLKEMTDEDLSTAMTRVHKTVARMVSSVETYTKPYALKKSQTRPQAPVKKPPKGRKL